MPAAGHHRHPAQQVRADRADLCGAGPEGHGLSEWFGFYLPAKAAPDVVQRANAALRAALAAPETIEGLELVGLESKSSTPAELAALQKSDTERWGPIVKAIGFSADS